VDLRALPAPASNGAPPSPRTRVRSVVEARVAEVWEEVLGVQGIGVDDDFFQIGGHSLLAVRMVAAIRDRFGRAVSLASFLREPTIAGVAASLHEQDGSSAVMVELRRGGAGPAFFCVHPIGGNAVCYVPLAAAMASQFYAFQSPAVGAPLTIEEMAGLYLRELRRVAPRGPYALGGWSFGGLVAFEMAHQLETLGERAVRLALFDTYPPSRDKMPLLLRFAADAARMLGRDADASALPRENARDFVLDALRREGLPADEMLATFERNSAAAERYRLTAIEHPINLFVAADGEGTATLPDEWSAWTRGGVRLHVVPGDHYTMLQPPHVSGLAAKLTGGGLP
jgi:thioesterase domain-containing protein/acyl carrier protein